MSPLLDFEGLAVRRVAEEPEGTVVYDVLVGLATKKGKVERLFFVGPRVLDGLLLLLLPLPLLMGLVRKPALKLNLRRRCLLGLLVGLNARAASRGGSRGQVAVVAIVLSLSLSLLILVPCIDNTLPKMACFQKGCEISPSCFLGGTLCLV